MLSEHTAGLLFQIMFYPPCWRTLGTFSFSPRASLRTLTECSVGAVLYTTYLQTVGALHPPSSQSSKRVYPPPPIYASFVAGSSAGAVQSVVAAPLDALSVRFRTSEIVSGKYKNMWQYGRSKLHAIGPRGVFAGWGLRCIKDTIGYGAFFAAFEYVKAQAYYDFLTMYYGGLRGQSLTPRPGAKVDTKESINTIKPHYAIEPMFLMSAGITASFAQQVFQHPLSLVQNVHFRALAQLDKEAGINQPKSAMLRNYFSAYRKTYHRCLVFARRDGGWRRWLYKGFWWNTVKQVPSTSAGLVIFELMRRRYGNEAEAVKIGKDGYNILLA